MVVTFNVLSKIKSWQTYFGPLIFSLEILLVYKASDWWALFKESCFSTNIYWVSGDRSWAWHTGVKQNLDTSNECKGVRWVLLGRQKCQEHRSLRAGHLLPIWRSQASYNTWIVHIDFVSKVSPSRYLEKQTKELFHHQELEQMAIIRTCWTLLK